MIIMFMNALDTVGRHCDTHTHTHTHTRYQWVRSGRMLMLYHITAHARRPCLGLRFTPFLDRSYSVLQHRAQTSEWSEPSTRYAAFPPTSWLHQSTRSVDHDQSPLDIKMESRVVYCFSINFSKVYSLRLRLSIGRHRQHWLHFLRTLHFLLSNVCTV